MSADDTDMPLIPDDAVSDGRSGEIGRADGRDPAANATPPEPHMMTSPEVSVDFRAVPDLSGPAGLAGVPGLAGVLGQGGDPDGPGFDSLSAMLWQERELLEQLVFALVAQRAVIPMRDPRWFRHAAAAVQSAVDAVSIHEVLRAAETERLTTAVGLPVQTPLRALAAVAPQPWDALLVEHRDALRALTAEVDEVVRDNRRLLVASEVALHSGEPTGQGAGSTAWWE